MSAIRTPSSGWRKIRRGLRDIGWLRSGYYLARAAGMAIRDDADRTRYEFDEFFAQREDPWNYDGARERARHVAELRALDVVRGGQKFRTALELGCAEGAFTQMLAPICEQLLAVDISDIAMARAASRCEGATNVHFDAWDLRAWPDSVDSYDLITAVHVLECVHSPLALRRVRARLVEHLLPGGHLLIGNVYQEAVSETSWWGKYLVQGGNWINEFIASHPALQTVQSWEVDLGGVRSRDMLLRKRA